MALKEKIIIGGIARITLENGRMYAKSYPNENVARNSAIFCLYFQWIPKAS